MPTVNPLFYNKKYRLNLFLEKKWVNRWHFFILHISIEIFLVMCVTQEGLHVTRCYTQVISVYFLVS